MDATTTTITTMAKRPAKAKSKSPESAAPKAAEQAKSATTIAAVARNFEVHERTVKSWFAKGCPHERGKYDLAAIAEWRESNIGVGDDEQAAERGAWETRRSRAAALKAELELKQLAGQLIDVKRTAQFVGQHTTEVKAHLMQLPDFAASLVKLSAAQKRPFLDALRKKIRQLCEGFERSLTKLAEANVEEETQAA